MAKTVDVGHEQTDEIIDQIEKKLNKEYAQAAKEVAEKYDDYMRRFKIKDEIKLKKVAAGEISQEEYERWRYGQVCIGHRWEDMKNQLAEDLVNTDSIARSITQGYIPEVYAINHNYQTYQVEHDAMIDTSYTLYNQRAVERLVKEDPNLIPYWEKPENKKKLEEIDMKWNVQKIGTSITQGILQGESIPEIKNRLMKVVGMDKTAATRNARTIMTGVENKARRDACDDLRKKGVDLNEMWVATLDGRTRHSHRHLHGSYRDPYTGKFANDLEYPGDNRGEPEEYYNCRCSLKATVAGYETGVVKSSPKMGGMSYDEWLEAGKGKAKWIDEGKNKPLLEAPVKPSKKHSRGKR